MLKEGDKFGKYTIVKRIGLDEQGNSEGANATVFVVGYKDKAFALKIPNNPERLDNLFREIGNWAKVSSHPNILTYYETVTHSGKTGFISEYIKTGSLTDWIKNSANLTLSQKLAMIDGILNGLEYLHSNLIFHRDLKPQNIFVKDNIPLLADFGSAKDYDFAEMQYAYGFTYKYAPPELVAIYDDFGIAAKYQITKFDDLWSVAIIICEILVRQYPFSGMSKIMKAELRPFTKNTDQNIIEFIQKALQKKRENRFQTAREMREALKNPQHFLDERAKKIKDSETIIDEDFDKKENLASSDNKNGVPTNIPSPSDLFTPLVYQQQPVILFDEPKPPAKIFSNPNPFEPFAKVEPLNELLLQREWSSPSAPKTKWQNQDFSTPFVTRANTLAVISLAWGILGLSGDIVVLLTLLLGSGFDGFFKIYELILMFVVVIFWDLIGGIPAIIIGFMAKKKIESSPNIETGRRMAIAGIVLGVNLLILNLVFVFLRIMTK